MLNDYMHCPISKHRDYVFRLSIQIVNVLEIVPE